jgi:epoxyqueuosine reductase QueG
MIETEIKSWMSSFVKNFQSKNHVLTEWKEPLIAFADANDPLFLKLKEVVSETHSLPNELLKNASTVITFFIPFKENIVQSNRDLEISSKEWAHAYVETNNLIAEVNVFLRKKLKLKGFETKVMPATHNFNEKELLSDWSHKHVAYIAGLGGFGLHKMLITEMGCCGRLGSVITSAKIEPTKRNNNEYCLYFHNQSCMKCVEKCVFDALSIQNFNRHKCYNKCLENAKIYANLGLVDVCGKCVSVVPCSFRNPVGS